ncbi:MAG TPA: ATP-binding protein [Gaiellaceae bacterium]|jgi:PAS domain S-box-containing protein|nr:ATP-binding protein [Gaiellaceae bacterium]
MSAANTPSQSLRAASAVADFGHLALNGASLEELLDEAVRLTAETLPAERVAVLRFDGAAKAFEVAAAVGAGWIEVGSRIELSGWSPASAALGRELPVVVDEVLGEPCGPGAFWESCRSAVVVPVRTRGTPDWGVLVVCSRESREWTPDEVVFVRLSANTLAEAVDTQHAEHLRARAEELVASAVESLPDIFAQFDPDLRATFVNRAMLTETGWAPSAVVGRRLTDVDPTSETLAFIERELQVVLETGETRTATITFRRDGEVRHHELHASPSRDANGRVSGVAAVSRNITERVRLEERLRHSSRIEALGQLSGGVAHDFNNLLVAIGGYSDLALRRLNGGPDDVRQPLIEIRRAADRASDLTRQLLAFSSKQVLCPEVVDLNERVREDVRMLERIVGETIEIDLDLDATIPHVRMDAGQLAQVLVNLAVNARDAMGESGILTIATRGVDDRVLLSVSDTGCGVDGALRDRIFEPFFTTKLPGHGTGLGLATVIGIVEQSGGHISVDSEPGAGATFVLDLPAADAETVDRVPAVAAAGLGEGQHVLVVEDDAVVRDLVAEALRDAGYLVDCASSSAEALERAADAPLDLLVTDVVMPRMGGDLLAHELRRRRPGLRVVFTSGYPSDLASGRIGDRDHFLQKPFSINELLAVASAALETPAAA